MRFFLDRTDAGKQLAECLANYKNQPDTVILALPRGGVPVAFEIAEQLQLPMTVFLVRKLGVPGYKELAMGAIAENDVCLLNRELITQFGATKQSIQAVISKEKKELHRRLHHYRQGEDLPNLKDKIVIVVDDGIATGATCKAAIAALQAMDPKKILLVTPVASRESIRALSSCVFKVISLVTPETFYNVGEWYHHFEPVTDEEVVNLLQKLKR